jgi:hypothetical protein
MNPLTPYLIWIKLGAAAALIVGLFMFGHHIGAASVQAKWTAETSRRDAADNAAILKRTADNVTLAAAQSETNTLLKKGYSNEITRLNAVGAAAGRLRIGSAICPRLDSASDTQSAGGSHATDPSAGLVRPDINRDIDALKLKVGTVFASCRAAQTFIRDNGMAPDGN